MLRSPSLANTCGGRLAGYVRSSYTAWLPAGPGSAAIGGNGCGRRGSRRGAGEALANGLRWSSGVGSSQRSERPREVADGGTVDLELNIMPWGSRPVVRIEIDGLLVAHVTLIVTAAVAQVDPTDERHVPVGASRCLMIKSFWWWLPSRRTRSSSRTSPPASLTLSRDAGSPAR